MNKKVVVVIGGTGGIGNSVCKRLAGSGVKVILTGRDKKDAAKKAGEIEGEIISEKLDILDQKSVSALLKKIKKKYKKINAVVNLAGIFEPFGEFEKVNLSLHKQVFEVNLFGSFNVVYSILPIYKKQKFGKIILFSGGGVGGDIPLVNAASYFTSKAAVSVFTEVLAKEVEQFNIQINAVLPGQILTKSTKKTLKMSRKKLGPVLGPATDNLLITGGNSVEKVVELISFLISEESNYITGRTISAKWDDLASLKKTLTDEKLKLRRIDGKVYKKV